MAARHRRHHGEAPRPTWIVTIKAAPPPAPARKLAPPAYSPVLLSPSMWKNPQKGRPDGGVPASPRIGCMGQVKGGRRRCSSARGAAARGKESGFSRRRSLAGLLTGLFGRRRGAYSKITDVPSDSSSSCSGSSRGARAAAAARPFDQPLPVPVVRRPTMEENAPSLWERRRGGGKALEGLQLM